MLPGSFGTVYTILIVGMQEVILSEHSDTRLGPITLPGSLKLSEVKLTTDIFSDPARAISPGRVKLSDLFRK